MRISIIKEELGVTTLKRLG